jgi:hypothetical protein
VEKEHLILPVHLSGEGTSYPSGATKWRRNMEHQKNNMFLLHFDAPEG